MSPSRLLWFTLGGASAFWWIRHRDEMECRERRDFHHGGGPFWGNCMKHSWRLQRSGNREIEGTPSTPATPVDFEAPTPSTAPEIQTRPTLWDAQTSEKITRTVETGVNTVMSILENLEKSLREERARIREVKPNTAAVSANTTTPSVQPSSEPSMTQISEPKPLNTRLEPATSPSLPKQLSKARSITQSWYGFILTM
ncbi:hypothetical protein FRC02_009074 [Tulasnella sp. 418]|nr:hypothetical protein FRC02_009074 [Tulasnella sp. 418]